MDPRGPAPGPPGPGPGSQGPTLPSDQSADAADAALFAADAEYTRLYGEFSNCPGVGGCTALCLLFGRTFDAAATRVLPVTTGLLATGEQP